MNKSTTIGNNNNTAIKSEDLEKKPSVPTNTTMKNNEGENSIEQAVARQQELIQDKRSKSKP